MHSRYV